MFEGLFGMLVSGLAIFVPALRGGSTVPACAEFVESCALLCEPFGIVSLILGCGSILAAVNLSNRPIENTLALI
jgi:hypothetical protein